MLTTPLTAAAVIAFASSVAAAPAARWNSKKSYYDYFDLQGHRGARGEVVERWAIV